MSDHARDLQEISNLKARYADAVDGGWGDERPHDPDAVIALFVRDGIWDGGAFGGGEGHDGIREYMATGAALMPFVLHHMSAPRIEVDGDRARGRWHAILATIEGDTSKLWVGIYDDRFVRTPDGWRFSHSSSVSSSVRPRPAEP